MAKFQIQTVDCTMRCYILDLPTDDYDQALEMFENLKPDELKKALVNEIHEGENLDFMMNIDQNFPNS